MLPSFLSRMNFESTFKFCEGRKRKQKKKKKELVDKHRKKKKSFRIEFAHLLLSQGEKIYCLCFRHKAKAFLVLPNYICQKRNRNTGYLTDTFIKPFT